MSERARYHRNVALAALPVCGGALLFLAVFAFLEPTQAVVAIATACGAFAGGAAAAASTPRVHPGQAAVAAFVFAAVALALAGGADLHDGWGYAGRDAMLERVALFCVTGAAAAFLGALVVRRVCGDRVATSDAAWVGISVLMTLGCLVAFVLAVGIFRVAGIEGPVVPFTAVGLFVAGVVAAGYLVQTLAPRPMPRIAASGTFLLFCVASALGHGVRASSGDRAYDAGNAIGAAFGAIVGGLLFAWIAKAGAQYAWRRRERAAPGVPSARAVD